MTATIELNSARRKLQIALGSDSAVREYFGQLKLWFRKQRSKEEFDAEARKMLPLEHAHLHNTFLLAILNKCQTLAGLTGGVGVATATTPSKMQLMGVRAAARQKAKAKGSVPYRAAAAPAASHRFLPAEAQAQDIDELQLYEKEERGLDYAFRGPTLPDASLIHGRVLVGEWEAGLEGGGAAAASADGRDDDEAVVQLIATAVEQQLRRLICGLLTQRNGFKVRRHGPGVALQHSVGGPVPNPWLRGAGRRSAARGAAPPEVAESTDLAVPTPIAGPLGDIDPLVPVGRPSLLEAESRAAVDLASSRDEALERSLLKRPKRAVSLLDLLHLLRRERSIIPSHTVYALTTERLVSWLHHDGYEE